MYWSVVDTSLTASSTPETYLLSILTPTKITLSSSECEVSFIGKYVSAAANSDIGDQADFCLSL